ncbi:MAG: hypothetical protein GF398_10355 [Chitinivibrionales bacterium]|nr:hypothetical protein [Chitinivibrionales bacterium]
MKIADTIPPFPERRSIRQFSDSDGSAEHSYAFMKYGNSRIGAACLIIAVSLISTALMHCEDSTRVLITGRMRGYRPQDAVFVALADSWEGIYRSPQIFEIDSTGAYTLAFSFHQRVPPINFVKNNKQYAELHFINLWGDNPQLENTLTGRTYPLVMGDDFVIRAEIVF